MKVNMSPSGSPNQFIPPEKAKHSIRTVNKYALYAVVGTLTVAVGALAFEASSRSSTAKESGKESLPKGKPLASHPPRDLDNGRGSAKAGAPVQGPSGVQFADQAKEQQEFQRQIRLQEQKRALAKVVQAEAAETSDIGVDISRRDQGSVVATTEPTSEVPSPTGPRTPAGGPGMAVAGAGSRLMPSDLTAGSSDPNMQGRKEAYAEKEFMNGYLPTRKQAQISPFEVKQGTVIPGIMISGINSDLPGQIIAQVSQNVYDTATGRHLLIPQGTRLVGSYDSFVAVGQERAMVAWRRLQFPDGASLDILNMPGADEGGYAGFNDQVNNHYMKIFGSAIMLSLVGAGYQISQPQQHAGDPVTAQNIVAAQLGQQLAQVSGELIRRNMQIQPTIEIRPGYRFNIMVNKDMILEPYVEQDP